MPDRGLGILQANDFVARDDVLVKFVFRFVVNLLALERSKVGCEPVIVVLAPFIKRMIVTACALQSDSQENLADRFGRCFGIAMRTMETGRWMFVSAFPTW